MCKRTMITNKKPYLSAFLHDFGYEADAVTALENAYDVVFGTEANVTLFQKLVCKYQQKRL